MHTTLYSDFNDCKFNHHSKHNILFSIFQSLLQGSVNFRLLKNAGLLLHRFLRNLIAHNLLDIVTMSLKLIRFPSVVDAYCSVDTDLQVHIHLIILCFHSASFPLRNERI